MISKSKNRNKIKFRDIIISIIIAAICILFNLLTVNMRLAIRGDSIHYMAISNCDFEDAQAPFKYRVLTPFLASLFSDKRLGFIIVTFFSFFVSGILFYFLMRKLGFNHLYSLIAEILFLFSWRGIHFVYNPFVVDSLSYMFIILFAISMLKENKFILSFILFLAILNRETALLLPIIYFLYLFKCKNSKLTYSIKETFIVSIPLVFGLVLIRILMAKYTSPHNISIFDKYISDFKNIMETRFSNVHTLVSSIISPWGILWIFSLVSFKKAKCIIKIFFVYVLVLLLTLLFIHDSNRMLSMAFIFIIPLSIVTIKDITEKLPNDSYKLIFVLGVIGFYRYWSQLNWLTNKSAEKIINLTKEILYFSSKNIVCVCTGLISFMLIYYLLKESKSLKKNIIPIILIIAFFISIFYWQSIFEKGKIDKEKTFGLLVLKNIKSASDTFMYLGRPCKLPKKWLKAEQKWQLAEKSLDIGDTSTAKKLFEEAKKLVPDVVKRYNLLAVYYNSIKKPDSALIWLYKGISFMPNDTTALTNIGMILYKKRLLDSAMMYFRKILLIEPKNAGALNNIGVIFLNKGLCDSAMCYFKDAIKYNPEKWAYVRNYIFGLKRCKKNKELIKAIDYAVKKFPKNSEKAELIKLKRSLLSKLQQDKN